jgi:hypothetical protein
MKMILRPLAALVAVGLALALVPASATGAGDCATKCKDTQASCDLNCDQQKLICVGKCGGPPPLGSQACIDQCASARNDCSNNCLVNEKICEGKCVIPIPLP